MSDSCPPCLPRPVRSTILDSEARQRTLASDEEQYQPVFTGDPAGGILVLGLGPDVDKVRLLLQRAGVCPETALYWMESPAFMEQLPQLSNQLAPHTTFAHRAWPAFGQQISPEDLPRQLQAWGRAKARPTVWRYKPALRLFADFWGPILGQVESAYLIHTPSLPPRFCQEEKKASSESSPCSVPPPRGSGAPVVLLPGDERNLLTLELEQAFAAEGFNPVRLPPDEPCAGTALRRFLRHQRPALFMTVNLRGLDPDGLSFHLLKACGVPVAAWFVDNPWHVLSGLRLAWWKALSLFVTDATFVEPLQRHGAQKVVPLPLAAWYTKLSSDRSSVQPDPRQMTPMLFVGRSAFPHKASFFAGVRVPEKLLRQAETLLLRTGSMTDMDPTNVPVPDATWWAQQLKTEQGSTLELWPGKACRQIGWGAEQCSLMQRRLFLEAAAPLGLTVYGDEAWRTLLPASVTVRPAVDYYTTLPTLYQSYTYTLNVTSLLLPGGLTQRHFDVWMAGGLLLTNHTAGLDLFPCELTEPVTLSGPKDVRDRLRRLEADPDLRIDLRAGWQDCLATRHTYRHRVRTLVETCVKIES